MYLKSTVAGHPIEEQVAGQRIPTIAQQTTGSSAPTPAPAGSTPAVVQGLPAGLPAGASAAPAAGGRVGSSSNLVAQPYPAGTSAAVAAAGGVANEGFNTAAAQQAAKAKLQPK